MPETTSKDYKNIINGFISVFPGQLSTFNSAYISDPTHSTDSYTNAVNAVQKTLDGLFSTTNDIQKSLETYITTLKDTNNNIANQVSKNADYSTLLGIANDNKKSSDIMNENYKELYKMQYFANAALIVGILFVFYLLYKFFI